MTELIDIKEERKKADEKPTKATKQKFTKADAYLAVSRAMNRDPFSLLMEFPQRFYLYEPAEGSRLVLKEMGEDVVELVDEEAVVNEILKYSVLQGSLRDAYKFEYKHAKDCMKFWKAETTPIPKPKMVSWPGEEGKTFRRLPWTLGSGPTPLFDEIMSRMSNAEAFQCFIGSLMFIEADRQQYVWLYGQGMNGKGAISRVLRKALNGAYSAQNVPINGDRFWTSGLLGARLVVFPDCNNTSFVTAGLFKSLTGGDPVRIERKNQQPFTTELSCKFMFLSNERPSLSSEKADKRRAIFCELGEVAERVDPLYEEKLWQEAGYFLSGCMQKYISACPNHEPIETGCDQVLDDWISTVEEDFESVFSLNFNKVPGRFIRPADMQQRLKELFTDRRKELEFRAWLERTHGIKKRTDHSKPGTPKIYAGWELLNLPRDREEAIDVPN